ncbi:hypothetical protein PCANC_03485 [Puccinia coronata f. sp. avenae]|uniref:Uncharacterized protein n=1 Tax=Puccinia coronata f. sp. avenae TaxID=200324 RepID=A0A2N5W069_9BASI|nr:hypothetical protein PCANC_03485 [Puccinia coronata f. sp. avenae]
MSSCDWLEAGQQRVHEPTGDMGAQTGLQAILPSPVCAHQGEQAHWTWTTSVVNGPKQTRVQVARRMMYYYSYRMFSVETDGKRTCSPRLGGGHPQLPTNPYETQENRDDCTPVLHQASCPVSSPGLYSNKLGRMVLRSRAAFKSVYIRIPTTLAGSPSPTFFTRVTKASTICSIQPPDNIFISSRVLHQFSQLPIASKLLHKPPSSSTAAYNLYQKQTQVLIFSKMSSNSAQSTYFSFPSYESHFASEIKESLPAISSLSQKALEPILDFAAEAQPIGTIHQDWYREAEVELILYLRGTIHGSFPAKAASVYSESSSSASSVSTASRFSIKSIKSWWRFKYPNSASACVSNDEAFVKDRNCQGWKGRTFHTPSFATPSSLPPYNPLRNTLESPIL